MRRQKDLTTYGLYFSLSAMKRDQYSTRDGVRLSVVVLTKDGKIRNPSRVEYQSFDDLEFTASWSLEHPDWPVDWNILYPNLYYVDLQEARRYLKTLERVEKVRERFPVRPETFGQFCVLMCKGLGITKFVVERESWGSTYDEAHHNINGIENAQSFLDYKISEARKPEANADEPSAVAAVATKGE